MAADTLKFSRRLIQNGHEDNEYYATPILAHMDQVAFVAALTALTPASLQIVSGTLKQRYSFGDDCTKLRDEGAWLTSVNELLAVERAQRAGKISGVLLGQLVDVIDEAVQRLAPKAEALVTR